MGKRAVQVKDLFDRKVAALLANVTTLSASVSKIEDFVFCLGACSEKLKRDSAFVESQRTQLRALYDERPNKTEILDLLPTMLDEFDQEHLTAVQLLDDIANQLEGDSERLDDTITLIHAAVSKLDSSLVISSSTDTAEISEVFAALLEKQQAITSTIQSCKPAPTAINEYFGSGSKMTLRQRDHATLKDTSDDENYFYKQSRLDSKGSGPSDRQRRVDKRMAEADDRVFNVAEESFTKAGAKGKLLGGTTFQPIEINDDDDDDDDVDVMPDFSSSGLPSSKRDDAVNLKRSRTNSQIVSSAMQVVVQSPIRLLTHISDIFHASTALSGLKSVGKAASSADSQDSQLTALPNEAAANLLAVDAESMTFNPNDDANPTEGIINDTVSCDGSLDSSNVVVEAEVTKIDSIYRSTTSSPIDDISTQNRPRLGSDDDGENYWEHRRSRETSPVAEAMQDIENDTDPQTGYMSQDVASLVQDPESSTGSRKQFTHRKTAQPTTDDISNESEDNSNDYELTESEKRKEKRGRPKQYHSSQKRQRARRSPVQAHADSETRTPPTDSVNDTSGDKKLIDLTL